MSKQWTIVLVVAAALGLGVVALTRFGAELDQVDVATPAPDFQAVDLATGDSIAFRQRYKGAVTLINIWATWCIPCREEMPAMQRVYTTLAPRGFRIAAVSIDEGGSDPVRAFAQDLHLTFDILHDRSGAIQQIYQTTGVPESFLINHDGVIIKRVIGAYEWDSPANRMLIERLLDEPAR